MVVPQIDKPGAQLERVKQELADIGMLPEEWGGDVAMVPVTTTTSASGSAPRRSCHCWTRAPCSCMIRRAGSHALHPTD